jgi:putative heme-binding domain-containing protein
MGDPMKPLVLALALGLVTPTVVTGAEVMPALVGMLGESRDAQVQVDVLRGLRDATQGAARVPMPAGWEAVEARLMTSPVAEVRSLARVLGFRFGSSTALAAMRGLLRDRSADPGERQEALRALSGIREATLPATLRELLQEPAMRGAAVRGLAAFDDPATGPALLAVMGTLSGGERRDALNTLASRPTYARELLAAMEAGTVPVRDLTAEVLRQLRSLKDDVVNAGLAKVYGAVREVSADKQSEIERYKRLYRAGGSTQGDAIRGRAVYAKVCQQCHSLFEVGGKVGPDLTGSNRGDLDYVLQNIVDPNAVIPNEYRASTVELKDGRVLTGIVKQGEGGALVVATANETLTVARSEVVEVAQSELSMMPEELLQPLADQEFRDLIYYLARSGQSPMQATADTAGLLFNGRGLALWQPGDDGVWAVEGGEIVGRMKAGGGKAEVLRSDLIAADFRWVLRVKVGSGAAAVVVRGEPRADGTVRGYQVGLGAGGSGKVEVADGRVLAGSKAVDAAPGEGGWSTLEVLAVGGRIRTAVDGKVASDVEDAGGARQGMLALVLPPGDRDRRVVWKDLRLEVDPKTGNLETVGVR